MPATFTPEQIAQILEAFFNTVGARQYIGARYVPIFGRKGESSIAWDNTKPYEPLTIVLYQGNSYTSRQFVPIGVEITNQEFWAVTGNYNAQIEQYRRETAAAQNDIDTLLPKADFSAENTVKKYIDRNKTRVLSFDTVADMQAANSLVAGMTCHTNGFHESGDGGAAYYIISASGVANGMDVLKCSDNLYASIIYDNTINVTQLGAQSNGDIADILQTIINAEIKCIDCAGSYRLSKTVSVNKSNIKFVNGEILLNGVFNAFYITSPFANFENMSISGLFDQSPDSYDANIAAFYIHNTSCCVIENCRINDIPGNGIFNKRSNHCVFRNNTITNVYANSIICANAGADYNVIDSNVCDTTATQNCIFITADSGSEATSETIHNNTIINNVVINAGDTGIESGINSYNTLVAHNTSKQNKTDVVNPDYLFRDCFNCKCYDNMVERNTVAGSTYAGIATVPQHGAKTDKYFLEIKRNVIKFAGEGTTFGVRIGCCQVDIEDNYIESVRGVILAQTDLSDIRIKNNTLICSDRQIQLNWPNESQTIERISIENNGLTALDFYRTTIRNCMVVDALFNDSIKQYQNKIIANNINQNLNVKLDIVDDEDVYSLIGGFIHSTSTTKAPIKSDGIAVDTSAFAGYAFLYVDNKLIIQRRGSNLTNPVIVHYELSM